MTELYNTPFSLFGKIVLVTGASSGIGKATAIECSKMGAILVLNGRNEARLEETFEHLSGDGHRMIVGDLTVEEDLNKLVAEVKSLDGIVHCAGISGHKLFSYLKQEEIDDMFSINYLSPLKISQFLLKAKKVKKGGSIIFMTSTSGILSSYIGGSLYSSTKGAINGLVKGMALELAPKKIRVNSVMPSMIETPIMNGGDVTDEQFEADKQLYPLKRYGKPEEVAYAVIYLLSDASSWITGTNLLMDGGRSISY
jgi:NAD(P)-dependent dehydrogenase (short-subunit alcohol dehydrogenase family)|nr:SDR family oxidoreductase [Bacteroides intestinalis]